MKTSPLFKGSLIKTIFTFIELVILIVVLIITFSNDGTSPWGYWGAVAVVLVTLSPIIIYVIASVIFNIFNMNIVLKNQHTIDTVKKYYIASKIYFILGIITGSIYGFLLVPIFLLENIFLFNEYQIELNKIENT